MTPGSTTHLSREALDDVLIGLGSSQSHAHLAGCPECRAQVDAFREDVRLLNAASMAWSKSRFPQKLPRLSQGARMRVAFGSWSAVAAALLVMALAIWHHRLAPPQLNQANTAQSRPLDSEAQIAQDNQLLQAVNAAISPDERSPLDEYKIVENPHPHGKANSKTRVK